jgi:membrane fusion protein (multidrug efflux system)
VKIIFFTLFIFFFSSCDYFNDQNEVEKPKQNLNKKQADSKKKDGVKQQPTGLPVKAIKVSHSSLTDEVTAVGSLISDESVVIRPEIDGRITKIHFVEGQNIKKNTILISLDNSEYLAQLDAVKAELKTESKRLERSLGLLKDGFISKDAFDIQRGKIDILKARVMEAESRLYKTKITAPFSGIIGLRNISKGAYVRAGHDIAILENLFQMKVDFKIPEIYSLSLKKNQDVFIEVDALPGEKISGKIYAFEPALDEVTRSILIRAKVPNDGYKLKSGMFARVTLILNKRDNVITIPEEALWPQGVDNFVYKVIDNKVILTKVSLGKRVPNKIEITQGLSLGDTVVTEGQIKLRNGTPVMVLPSNTN